MKRTIMALAVLPLLLTVTFADSSLVVTEVDEVPPNASPLLINPSFEGELSQDEFNGWYAFYYTQRWNLDAADGDWSLYQSVPTGESITWALQVSNVRDCIGGSVWYDICYQMRTNEPPEAGEVDICEASLYDEGRLFIAELVSISNLEATGQWACNLYRVDGVPGVFEESTIFLHAWDSGERMSVCLWDRISGWCVKDMPHTVYLPYLRRGE